MVGNIVPNRGRQQRAHRLRGRAAAGDAAGDVEIEQEVLAEAREAYRRQLNALRAETIFNVGGSSVAGAKAIVEVFELAFGKKGGRPL